MKRVLALPVALAATLAGAATGVVQDQCGPFTDVSPAFCPYVLEMYYLGLTAGTSATTFSPDNPVTRGQAAVFVSKGVNQAIARSSRRAALGQWWTSGQAPIALSPGGVSPEGVASDGFDVWATNSSQVNRIRASDGRLIESWSGASGGVGVLVAMGRVFVTGNTNPGKLYMLDPGQPAGPVTTVASNLGQQPMGIAFDGSRIWTANLGASVSIITPSSTLPWAVTNVTPGLQVPQAVLFDGRDIWVADNLGTLYRLNSSGAITQTVATGNAGIFFPVFDGTNIWVPARGPDEVVIVRAADGAIVQRLTGNGLEGPFAAAFDGQRVLITGETQFQTGKLSVWRAADLAPLGSTDIFTPPRFACSDSVNFWVSLRSASAIAKY